MASAAIGTKAVGSVVKLKVDGTARNFIVVHQGLPGSMYDASCDGTWLLMEDIYEKRQWHSSDVNDYANSTVNNYLNNTVINKFDADIKAQIKTVKIPYRPGSGVSKTVNSGANGLSAKILLLTSTEVNIKNMGNGWIPTIGAPLDYFKECPENGWVAEPKRVAKLNGSACNWELRDPSCNSDTAQKMVNGVYQTGYSNQSNCTKEDGIRFAMVVNKTLMVYDNSAPTTPASITIPESIQGGTGVTVSWSAATDEDGNLEGYVVERSTDGGGTWTQIYQGGATQTTNTVPAGSETVMYRVKAYDAEGLYSTYRNSAQVSVFNNSAPNAPASITVPSEVLGGGTLAVTWGAASDPDNNLTGYELERQADGGEWTQVYKGADTSYTDNIMRGWNSVNYRVRSYDAYNAVSGYATGTARAVNNNRAPIITCGTASGSDLGTKTEGFTVAYSASDADGDAVTVTEAIDGAELRSFLLDGVSAAMNVTGDTFFKVLNGAHTLTITASDGKAAAVHKLTFTKSVTAASVTLAKPLKADAKITICVLSVSGSIPADAQYSVKVTNNASDDAPVWEDCTTEVKNGGNHIFTNETAANGFAFNFKVEAEQGESGVGGYISSVQGGFQ